MMAMAFDPGFRDDEVVQFLLYELGVSSLLFCFVCFGDFVDFLDPFAFWVDLLFEFFFSLPLLSFSFPF
ncbi:hypothetical protein BGX38DRAFT_1220299 [Terfezia claveryi]|nr:hypothetical protein BGX38DRAFT_1220299 [Terfezia claveryi]